MPFGENITTAIIAIYGALLSSIALGWNIYRQFTDKGRLSVQCYIGNFCPAVSKETKDYLIKDLPESLVEWASQNIHEDRDYLIYKVTDIGRKPILVTQVGGGYRNGEQFLINPNCPMPKELKPGEYFLEYSPDLSILDKDLRFLGVWDSLGKIHKADRKTFRMLKRKGQAKKV